jgi:hypothetical protein
MSFDAALVLFADEGDDIIASDIDDLRRMAEAAGRDVRLTRP